MSLPKSVHVVSHPLVQHKLTKMRDRQTSSHPCAIECGHLVG